MLNASRSVLEDAEYYAQSDYLRAMLPIRIFFATIAFILLTALHWNRNKFIAHPSLKILLNFHFFWIYLTCLCTVLDHIYTVYLLVTMSSPSDLLQTERQCLLRKGILCLLIYGAVSSMFVMSFERWRASSHFRTYERTSKAYGYKLAVAHLIITGIFTAAYYLSYGYDEPVVAMCTITTPRGETNHQIVATILMVMELWTIIAFEKLLRKNRKMQKSGGFYSLTERFQITENLRMLRIMLPIVWSHVSLTCITIVIYLIGVNNGLGNRSFPLFEDTISLTFTQGYFMSYYFFRQFRKDSIHSREVIATNSVTGEKLSAAHSAVIQAGWNDSSDSKTTERRSSTLFSHL